jgi:hypothetical protein
MVCILSYQGEHPCDTERLGAHNSRSRRKTMKRLLFALKKELFVITLVLQRRVESPLDPGYTSFALAQMEALKSPPILIHPFL